MIPINARQATPHPRWMRLPLRTAVLLFLMLFSSCAVSPVEDRKPAPTLAPTPSPSPSETPTTAPTLIPTATQTVLPPLPEGPLVWSGQTRPLLMAHYMPWYQAPSGGGSWGWHWTMNHFAPSQSGDGQWKNLASHYTPLTGPYDSSDQAVLEYQVQLMKLSGIDGVIVDWYGSESLWDYGLINASTAKLFQAIQKAGLKFVICYEDQTVKNLISNGRVKKEDAIVHGQNVMRYLQDTWFGDDAYLKVNGQPLLFTFGPQYYKSGKEWKEIFSAIDPQPLFITLDNPTPGAAVAAYPWPPMWASQGGVLSHDGLLTYLTDFYDKAEHWKYRVGGAFPGFHDIYKEANVGSSYGYLDALDGKTFRFTLQKALDANPDMIQLITWNDYGEGTILEPTTQFEYRYLEMVQEARKATSGAGFPFNAQDLRLPLKLYQQRLQSAGDADALAQLDQAAGALLGGDLVVAEGILNR